MARSFNGTSQYLENASAILTDAPISFAMCVNITDNTKDGPPLSIYRSTTGANLINLHYLGATSTIGWRAFYSKASGSTASQIQAGSRATAGINYAACAWSAYTSAPVLYVNGVSQTSGSSVGAGGTLTVNRTGIGSYVYSGTRTFYGLGGPISYAAIWNVALTVDELLGLTAGFDPLCIRPASLVGCWPLGGFYGDRDEDLMGAFDLTPTASPTFTQSPRIISPAPLVISQPLSQSPLLDYPPKRPQNQTIMAM